MSNETMRTPADVRELAAEIIRSLDLIARNYDSYEYGLPVMTHYDEMVDTVVALLRTPRGEGKAVRLLGLAMERAELLCQDAGRSEWPLSDFGRDMLQARLDTVRDLIGDALAALRSEASGQGGIHPDPETWRCRQCGGYADHYRDCPALRSEAQGEDELAALVVHMWRLKEQRGPMYTESGDFYVDFRRAYELAAARTNGGSDALRRYVEAPKAHICDGGDCGLEPCAETPVHREPGHARTVRPPRAARRGEGGA